MQVCMACQKAFTEGAPVIVKCRAVFVPFVDGMHGVDIVEELTICHEACEEDL